MEVAEPESMHTVELNPTTKIVYPNITKVFGLHQLPQDCFMTNVVLVRNEDCIDIWQFDVKEEYTVGDGLSEIEKYYKDTNADWVLVDGKLIRENFRLL